MRFRTNALALVVLATLASTGWADETPTKAERDAARRTAQAERQAERQARQAERARLNRVRAFAKGDHKVQGDALDANVARVSEELTWYDDLDEARRAAIEANKPILWVQALGDLSGLL